jgi:hypothetical protein
MRTCTNLAWPGDPYRTGQQLYRRPAPALAAFTAVQAATGDSLVPSAVAIVYLPLHRTRAVSVTEQTLTFGFRAASIDDPAGMPALAAVADLDLLQARRHAAVLAGHHLAGDLAALRQAAGAAQLRGLAAVEREWPARGHPPGMAATFDCALDLPGSPPLEHACRQAAIAGDPGGPAPGPDRPADWQAAALAVERALMIALVCARHLGRYQWAGTLRTGQLIAAAAWDCLGTDARAMPGSRVAPGRAGTQTALPAGARQ